MKCTNSQIVLNPGLEGHNIQLGEFPHSWELLHKKVGHKNLHHLLHSPTRPIAKLGHRIGDFNEESTTTEKLYLAFSLSALNY